MLHTLWRRHAIVNTGGEVFGYACFQTKYLFIVYADFDSSRLCEVRTFYEIKANNKNEIFLL